MCEEKSLPVDTAEVILLTDDHYEDSKLARTISASDAARHVQQMYTDYDKIKMTYEVYATNVACASYARRGVKVKCRLCECEFPTSAISEDEKYRIWSTQFVENISSLMIYLGNNHATVYFHGRYEIVVPVFVKTIVDNG